jgi:S-formylglutathione hydrolase FrmB
VPCAKAARLEGDTGSTRPHSVPIISSMPAGLPLRSRLVLLCALALLACAGPALGAGTARAAGQQVQTWDLASRFVSPKDAVFNLTPAQAAEAGPGGLRTAVVLPENYTPEHCWPVLYLLHGAGTPTEWLGSLDLIKQLNAIVVIPGGGDGQFTNWYNNGRRSPAWERWVFEELIPTVQSRLPICAGRESHAIAGTSMGGFAALLLASQRPDYFGSAASFSGMINIARPEIQIGFNTYKPVWGPPNGFYASGHNPTELVGNLRSTRVLVEVGNLSPYGPEDIDYGQARLVELVAVAQAKDFVAAARRSHLDIRYEQHTGIHTVPNFRESFTRMLAWNPFAAALPAPASWTYATVSQRGTVWGYAYRFTSPPTVLEAFSATKAGLEVRGAGRVAITPPAGKRFTATLPFRYAKGKATRLRGGDTTTTTKAKALPVNLTMTPPKPTLTQSITVRFRTDRKLLPTQTYQVLARQQTADCGVSSDVRVFAPTKGKVVKVRIAPGAGQGHPANRWCLSTGKVELIIVGRKSTGVQLGTFIGEVAFRTVTKAPKKTKKRKS